MKQYIRTLCATVLAALLLTACAGRNSTVSTSEDSSNTEPVPVEVPAEIPEVTLSGIQRAVIRGFEWGPGVVKTILSLNRSVSASSVTPQSFSVSETRAFYDPASQPVPDTERSLSTITTFRRVLDAYSCDRMGTRLEQDSPFVAVELNCDPEHGTPFCYDPVSGHNVLCNPYQLAISLSMESTLLDTDGNRVTALAVDAAVNLSRAYLPDLIGVERDFTYTGWDGRMLWYAFYEPPQDGKNHPLVIWLHGEGAGGENTVIPLLSGEVFALWGEEFQNIMGGAFIVIPQVPDFWSVCNDAGERGYPSGGSSVYLSTLISLIQSYVATTPGIDSDRIYIGGCSEGASMALDMIFHYPGYFAAAFPVCETCPAWEISSSRLESVRKVPVWLVYAENDMAFPPENYSAALMARLRETGANVHASVFSSVTDPFGLYRNGDGLPYEYDGHSAWIYFFRNACTEDGVNMWEWLARQKK